MDVDLRQAVIHNPLEVVQCREQDISADKRFVDGVRSDMARDKPAHYRSTGCGMGTMNLPPAARKSASRSRMPDR